jgi:TM2 domain-containing membrane protein YozV
MLGTVLSYSEAANEGVISGEDNKRYHFSRNDWKSEKSPQNGQRVDFVGTEESASQIYAVGATQDTSGKSKIAAALLALFLGGLGVHKFYLGYSGAGIVMLLVCLLGIALLGIPSAIVGLIAFIEAIIYLTKSDADFEEVYVRGRRAWF